jgi:hypothetical protein
MLLRILGRVHIGDGDPAARRRRIEPDKVRLELAALLQNRGGFVHRHGMLKDK